MKNRRKIFFLHIVYSTIICSYILIITQLQIGCPSQFLLHIPCPACGGTRAIAALLQFNFSSYCYYHPLALPLAVAIWLMIHRKLFKKERVLTAISVIILIANLLLFLWRWMNGLIP